MERACTTHRKGQPCSQDTPPHSPVCLSKPRSQRGVPTSCSPRTGSVSLCWWHPGQVEHEELPGLLHRGYLIRYPCIGVTVCLNHPRHTRESFPAQPSAPSLVCHCDQHGSTHRAHTCTGERDRNKRNKSPAGRQMWPGQGPGPTLDSALPPTCPFCPRSLKPHGGSQGGRDSAHLEFRISAQVRPCCLFRQG